MRVASKWPKRPTTWVKDGTVYISVPFTWNMPDVKKDIVHLGMFYKKVVIGGPGVYLCLHFYPDFLDGIDVEVGDSYPGVLQKVNRQATRTTTGCLRSCQFCGIGQGLIEPGGLQELPDWPDLPVIADNNILGVSMAHLERVVDRLVRHGWGDFEQGLDPRLLTADHARVLARVPKLIVRLALDSTATEDIWLEAYDNLLSWGVAKSRIRSYALIGFNTDPGEAWARCKWIEAHGVDALPMWFHRLDSLKHNIVTKEQADLGWNDYERRKIMQFYYFHKKAVA